jgi:hypothetical protein
MLQMFLKLNYENNELTIYIIRSSTKSSVHMI